MSKSNVLFNASYETTCVFSSMYPAPFVAPLKLDGEKRLVLFKSLEHYYQAHKTKNVDEVLKILKTYDPFKAKYFGSAKGGATIRKNFDSKRKVIMSRGLKYKYAQNPTLLQMLLKTKGTLAEDSPWDSYFGLGNDGEGQNINGKLQTELRDSVLDDPSYLDDYTLRNVKLKGILVY